MAIILKVNLQQDSKMLNLNEKELNTLYGILLTEAQELKDLIETVDNESDKNELSNEAKNVDSMLKKVIEERK